jgi:hypothetical protein
VPSQLFDRRRFALARRAEGGVRHHIPERLDPALSHQASVGHDHVASRPDATTGKADAVAVMYAEHRDLLPVKAAVLERRPERSDELVVALIGDGEDGAILVSPLSDPAHAVLLAIK